MLINGSNRFVWEHEQHMFGGNDLWAEPITAHTVGTILGVELIARYKELDISEDDNSTEVQPSAVKILEDALEVVDYAALPTERRTHILHGVIDTLAENGILGGEPEWVDIPDSSQSLSLDTVTPST